MKKHPYYKEIKRIFDELEENKKFKFEEMNITEHGIKFEIHIEGGLKIFTHSRSRIRRFNELSLMIPFIKRGYTLRKIEELFNESIIDILESAFEAHKIIIMKDLKGYCFMQALQILKAVK